MKLSRIGEFGLVERIRRIAHACPGSVVLGIGDDAAVLEPAAGFQTLLTTDAMVEGRHFVLTYTPLEDLGWKLLAVNISDIAAMGGIPKAALITLGLPGKWTVEDVDRLYLGLNQCAGKYQCTLAGGDIVSSEKAFLSLVLWGEVESGKWIPRGGARKGDRICVTGRLGSARVGLEVLSAGKKDSSYRKAVSKFLRPEPRLREARTLMDTLHITSMIDISDGLVSELGHISRESGLGCTIREEDLPVAGEARRWAGEKGTALTPFVLTSGEEYELLFTVDALSFKAWTGKHRRDVIVTEIGCMEEEPGVRMETKGRTVPLKHGGWDHFSGAVK